MSIEYAKVINDEVNPHQEEIDAATKYFKDLGAEDFIPICIKITESVKATGASCKFGDYVLRVDIDNLQFRSYIHTIRCYIMMPLLKDHFKKGKMPIIDFPMYSNYCCAYFVQTKIYVEVEVQQDSLLNC